jgi:hypothetical protein
MTRNTEDKDIRKLFEDKEHLLKEQPELGRSYSQFLRDWERYSKGQKISKAAEQSRDYLVFGASFKE